MIFVIAAKNGEKMAIITLTTDFGKQTQGVGNMEGTIYSINPDAKVIHLMHGLPSFEILSAARVMETVYYMPVGFHVCVVDPGVGTKRRAIIIETKRGDYLIGPDNGCLMAAPRLLGGIEKIVEITNEKYMLLPISPIFHGRHIFAPAAAHLSLGVAIEEFGKNIDPKTCVKAPYEEATCKGDKIDAKIIHINHYGSLHLNIFNTEWDKLGTTIGKQVTLAFGKKKISVTVCTTFGEVEKGKPIIVKDDYSRVEVAINLGSFADKYKLHVGDIIKITKN